MLYTFEVLYEIQQGCCICTLYTSLQYASRRSIPRSFFSPKKSKSCMEGQGTKVKNFWGARGQTFPPGCYLLSLAKKRIAIWLSQPKKRSSICFRMFKPDLVRFFCRMRLPQTKGNFTWDFPQNWLKYVCWSMCYFPLGPLSLPFFCSHTKPVEFVFVSHKNVFWVKVTNVSLDGAQNYFSFFPNRFSHSMPFENSCTSPKKPFSTRKIRNVLCPFFLWSSQMYLR